MPRLPTSLLHHARAINPLYPLLLQTCRTVPSAHNELRWLREHVETTLTSKFGSLKDVPERLKHRCVARLARRRGRGEPLQYLLGSQPFGELDIKCERGVLIPRQCTEASTEKLARMITSQLQKQRDTPPRRLIIVDFCTGTGCIPLLLLSLLSKSFPDTQIDITGVDISEKALELARKNYERNLEHYPNRERHSVRFDRVDVLDPKSISAIEVPAPPRYWHSAEIEDMYRIVVSNPPYISQKGFEQQTERSVRNYEPELALVPKRVGGLLKEPGSLLVEKWKADVKTEDIFYKAVERRAMLIGAQIMLVEVAGTDQAVRVAKEVMAWVPACVCCPVYDDDDLVPGEWVYGEIWGDDPDALEGCVEDITAAEKMEMAALHVKLKGVGMGRSVFFSRSSAETAGTVDWDFHPYIVPPE